MLATIAYTVYFLLLDFIWIGSVVANLYTKELGITMRSNFGSKEFAVFVFVYILLLGGNILFAAPLVSKSKWQGSSLFYGMAYGIVVYGVYSATNFFILTKWSIYLIITDVAWGGFLCASSLWVYFAISRYTNKLS